MRWSWLVADPRSPRLARHIVACSDGLVS